jgi:hypothetical protein
MKKEKKSIKELENQKVNTDSVSGGKKPFSSIAMDENALSGSDKFRAQIGHDPITDREGSRKLKTTKAAKRMDDRK